MDVSGEVSVVLCGHFATFPFFPTFALSLSSILLPLTLSLSLPTMQQRVLFVAVLLAATAAVAVGAGCVNPAVVTSFDIKAYMGRW